MTKLEWLEMQLPPKHERDSLWVGQPFMLKIRGVDHVCATDTYALLAVADVIPLPLALATPPNDGKTRNWFTRRMKHSSVMPLAKLKEWADKPTKWAAKTTRKARPAAFTDAIVIDKNLVRRVIAGATDKTLRIEWMDESNHFIRLTGKGWRAVIAPLTVPDSPKSQPIVREETK